MKHAILLLAAATFALGSATAGAQTIAGCKIEPNTKCAGSKLWRADLRGAKLAGADLSGADLTDSDMSKADLSNANLSKANLLGAKVEGVNWTGANLSGATMTASRDAYGVPQPKVCKDGSIGACK